MTTRNDRSRLAAASIAWLAFGWSTASCAPTPSPSEAAASDTAPSPTTVGIATRVAPPTVAFDAAGEIAALEARMDEVEDRIAALADTPIADDLGTLGADLGRLADDVAAAVARAAEQAATATDRERLDALGARVRRTIDRLQDALPDVDVRATVDPAMEGLFGRLRHARDVLDGIVPLGEPTATATP